MGRRVGSVAALIVAALLVGAGPGLWGASIAGSATRAPAPAPPPVGTCGTLVDAVFRSVPCEAPHDVEVTETLPASIPRQLRYADCRDRALEYVGSAPAGQPAATPVGQWTLPLRYGHAAVTGPSVVEIEGWSWHACVVRPLAPAPGGGYRGSVRQTEPERPTALRPCYESGDDIGVVTACTQPHAVEVLAVQAVPRRAAAGPARDLLRSCVATARSATGALDPTFGGRLAMRVLPEEGAPPVALSADVGAFYTSDGALDWRLCIVQAGPGFVLTETVAGVGSGPLPITGS